MCLTLFSSINAAATSAQLTISALFRWRYDSSGNERSILRRVQFVKNAAQVHTNKARKKRHETHVASELRLLVRSSGERSILGNAGFHGLCRSLRCFFPLFYGALLSQQCVPSGSQGAVPSALYTISLSNDCKHKRSKKRKRKVCISCER
jgi:hypothetical protein